MSSHRRNLRTCAVCGVRLRQPRRGRPRFFCSRRCGKKNQRSASRVATSTTVRELRELYAERRPGVCLMCPEAVPERRSVFCSQDCAREVVKALNRIRRKARAA